MEGQCRRAKGTKAFLETSQAWYLQWHKASVMLATDTRGVHILGPAATAAGSLALPLAAAEDFAFSVSSSAVDFASADFVALGNFSRCAGTCLCSGPSGLPTMPPPPSTN